MLKSRIKFITPNYNNNLVYGTLYGRKPSQFIKYTEMHLIKQRYDFVSDSNDYPEILKYFFKMKDKWDFEHVLNTGTDKYQDHKKYIKKYEDDVYFEFSDLEKLKKNFPNNKYPYYEVLIQTLVKDNRLQNIGHHTKDQTHQSPQEYSLEQFYNQYIAPIAKNIDIYLMVMDIKKLFDKYKNKLQNKYPEIYTLVNNLVTEANYNTINSPGHVSEQINLIWDYIQKQKSLQKPK
jgi:hypothetical protein